MAQVAPRIGKSPPQPSFAEVTSGDWTRLRRIGVGGWDVGGAVELGKGVTLATAVNVTSNVGFNISVNTYKIPAHLSFQRDICSVFIWF